MKVTEGRNEKRAEYMSRNFSAVGKWMNGRMWTPRRIRKRKKTANFPIRHHWWYTEETETE